VVYTTPMEEDYFKKYYQKNRDALNEYKRNYYREWRKRNREINNLRRRIYVLENKEKIAAQLKTRNIKIPNGTLCMCCHKRPAVEKHHIDYSNPHRLSAVCRQCHYKLNRRDKSAV